MRTRNQFLSTLVSLPEQSDTECTICFDDSTNLVHLPCTHNFCADCITKWLSRRNRNTCPTCRRVLFTLTETDRGPLSAAERTRIHAQAIEYSNLLTEGRFDVYDDRIRCTFPEVQGAAASAVKYLSAEHRPRLTARENARALIDTRALGRHLIAMGNLLTGYARARGRPYSGYQRRDWRLIISNLSRHLRESDGQVFRGEDVRDMAFFLRLWTFESLRREGVDVVSGRFFERDARLESASADLDVLVGYVVFLCMGAFEEREIETAEVRKMQREALERESTNFGKLWRWSGQSVFGGV